MTTWILAIVWYFPKNDLSEHRPMASQEACLVELARLREQYQTGTFSAGCLEQKADAKDPETARKAPSRKDAAPRGMSR